MRREKSDNIERERGDTEAKERGEIAIERGCLSLFPCKEASLTTMLGKINYFIFS